MQEIYHLGKNLQTLRQQYNYSQTYVANYLGITPQTYRGYEIGLYLPNLKHFIALAKLYDVSLDDLVE